MGGDNLLSKDFDLRRLQLIELDALRDVQAVCARHALPLFLIGGSALGAVRHKGFIPWDDDVDLALYRDDYMKFLNYAADELPKDKYFLQTVENDPGYHLPYLKLRLNGTVYCEKVFEHRETHKGIFLDIYPIDAVPEDPNRRKKQKYAALAAYFFFRGEPIKKQGKAINLASRIALRVLTKKRKRRLGFYFQSRVPIYDLESAKSVANIYGIKQYDKEIMPKAYFGQGTKAEFEGLEVTVPAEYDAYLTHLYGDYMQLPPESERVLKHDAVEVDFGPYAGPEAAAADEPDGPSAASGTDVDAVQDADAIESDTGIDADASDDDETAPVPYIPKPLEEDED